MGKKKNQAKQGNPQQGQQTSSQSGPSGSGGQQGTQQQQSGQGQQQRQDKKDGQQQSPSAAQGQPQQDKGPKQQQGGQGRQQQRGPAQNQQQSDQGRQQQPQGQGQRGPPPNQQQGGQGRQQQPQGAWGAQQRGPAQSQQQSDQGRQQQPQNQGQRGPPPNQQQGGQGRQQQPQGAWGAQQRGPAPNQQQSDQGRQQQPQGQGQRGPPPNQQQGGQGRQQQPQGAWGAQQRGPAPNQQQSDQGRQQPQGAWGAQQRGPPPNQQQGGQGRQQQPQGAWGAQQRGPAPNQQQGDQGRGMDGQNRGQGQFQSASGPQQRGPPRPQTDGRSQQQRGYGGQQQSSMQTSFQNLSVSGGPVLPFKPKSCSGIVRGNLGTSGEVEVNYLLLDLKNMPNEAYHYDVTITPDRPKKFLRPAFEQCKLEKFEGIEAAFDGNKSCYTVQRLKNNIEHTVQIPDSGNRMKEFKVEIKETGDCVVDLNSLRTYHNESVSDKPMRAIQVVDVVLSGNNHERGIRVGRSFFHKPHNPFDLEGGYEAWTGLFQAAILGEQPFLNVDIAHKSFPKKSTVIEYLRNQNIALNQSFDNYTFRDVERFLKGIDIVYEPPESFGSHAKKYRVLGIGEPPSKVSFMTEDGKKLTVAEYFQSKGFRFQFPNLNCLKVGSTVRSISLPIELCSIPEGQALNRKDDSKQVQKMIRFAATSTNVRKDKIMNTLRYFSHNESPIIRAFGIQIGSSFIKVPMRNLPAPYMEYLNGRTVTTSRGAWRMDRMQFLECSKPQNGAHKWCIIYEKNPRSRMSYNDLNNFKNNVIKESQNLNMNLETNAEIIEYNSRDLNGTLQDLAKKQYALVFVVLGNFNTYANVKQNAELRVGILTQCIKEQTIGRTARDMTVFSNILLKVNGKLNGTNHKIKHEQMMAPVNKVMYLGADVTHPSPDQREIPSVVGVAASHDRFGACYNMQYRLQRSTREDIEDMESIVTTHLRMYAKYQNAYPEQIIYYRDGVSDGQFPIIKNVELSAIKRACAKLKCKPKLTCVIVVKRHHTRFFPMKQPRDNRDFNNVDPGTVVDQHITHPNEIQFFMVSHQSIQGTAKPTRYNVIVDESNFDINVLQKLTYNLCHLFPRCNRVVSYPAPAYLAHLVAFRGRVYLEGARSFSKDLNREYENRLIKPQFMNTNPMYFI